MWQKEASSLSDRVVLAYSGGLDTSVGIGWLKDATGKEVIALAVDVGQGGEDMDDIRQPKQKQQYKFSCPLPP